MMKGMHDQASGSEPETHTALKAHSEIPDKDPLQPRFLAFGRRFFLSLRRTPLHPQWIVFRDEQPHLHAAAALLHGRVLEIGSGDRRLEKHLRVDARYIALDYPPSGKRYGKRPDVWGDAVRLPFRAATLDAVVLLEVLEHLPDPRTALTEASRVVIPGGCVLLSFPFLYPIHDAPYDYSRFTQFGLQQMAAEAGLELVRLTERGGPAEAAALLASLALAKTALQAVERRRLAALAVLPLTLLVPLINLAGWFLSRMIPVKQFMPTGYVAVLRKKA
jgi:SAM-dependent methyltransferase